MILYVIGDGEQNITLMRRSLQSRKDSVEFKRLAHSEIINKHTWETPNHSACTWIIK